MLIGVKVVVSTLLLFWILSRSNLSDIFEAAKGAYVPLLLLAYPFNFVGVFISAARWRGLLEAHGVVAPTSFVLKSVMVGIFFNNFLPSTVGGDAMRAYDSYRIAKRRSAMTSVVVDRMLGLLVLTMFALLSVPFAPQLANRVPLLPLWIGGGAALLVGLAWAMFFPPSQANLEGLLTKLPAAVANPARRVIGSFAAYRGQRGALARAFGWSLLLQTTVIIYYAIMARALGLAVPLHHFFLIVPLALYIMTVPITVNGIGVRESVFALFFAAYGIGSADAIAYAWLVYLGTVILGITGGVVYALRRVEPATPPVTRSVGLTGADG